MVWQLTLKWFYFFFYLEKCPFDILIYDFTVNEWVESCKTRGTFYFLKRNFVMTIQTNKRRPIIFKFHDNYQFHVETVLTLTWNSFDLDDLNWGRLYWKCKQEDYILQSAICLMFDLCASTLKLASKIQNAIWNTLASTQKINF